MFFLICCFGLHFDYFCGKKKKKKNMNCVFGLKICNHMMWNLFWPINIVVKFADVDLKLIDNEKFLGVSFLFEYFLVLLVLKIHKIFCVAIFVIVASHVFGTIPIRHLTCYSLFYMFFFFFLVVILQIFCISFVRFAKCCLSLKPLMVNSR